MMRDPVLGARSKTRMCCHFSNNNHSLTQEITEAFGVFRSKDYTAPVNFVSAGLRKTAAEEKPQQKGEEGSDDSDDNAPATPPAARSSAPKKLQMVKFVLFAFYLLQYN